MSAPGFTEQGSFSFAPAEILDSNIFQQYRSSRIDEVWKFDDSMIILHRICETPMICQCERLSSFPTARETFVHSFPIPEKFWFCTDNIASIELPHLVPRQRIDDCFKIHILL